MRTEFDRHEHTAIIGSDRGNILVDYAGEDDLRVRCFELAGSRVYEARFRRDSAMGWRLGLAYHAVLGDALVLAAQAFA